MNREGHRMSAEAWVAVLEVRKHHASGHGQLKKSPNHALQCEKAADEKPSVPAKGSLVAGSW